jgi:hypothetical protein
LPSGWASANPAWCGGCSAMGLKSASDFCLELDSCIHLVQLQHVQHTLNGNQSSKR